MEQKTIAVFNTQGKEKDKIELDTNVFSDIISHSSIYQAVNAYRANQRCGLAATKTRGEVSGGGKKPWKQKGTGRARVGSTRSPLWRHGGVTFGPHPRDFSTHLPEKIKSLALKSALSAKVNEKNIIVLEDFKLDKPKTKEAVTVLSNFKIDPKKTKVLVLLDVANAPVAKQLENIAQVVCRLAKDANTYEVLSAEKIIITKNGLQQLTERLIK